MASRPSHRASRSFQAIRTSVAVLPMAPFSPGRSEIENSCRARLGRANLGSIFPRKGAGFESQEPTSPEVSCIGQIKLKHRLAKECKQEKPSKEEKKKKKTMFKLKKFIFGGQNNGDRAETEGENEENRCTEGVVSYPSLGQLKRYTSGSYEAKFGNMLVQKDAEVVGSMSGPLSSETLQIKGGRKEEGLAIWERRSATPPKELEVCRIPAERVEVRKPLTT